ncbi:MAG TPA: ATP-binding protein [Candidatus Binatia bacterium]|nr:ATP-binding protein [Candidatus Binatia bacterium]
MATVSPAPVGSAPLRDLMAALDDRHREITGRLADLDRDADEAEAERGRVRLALARSEEARYLALEHRRMVRDEVLAAGFRESRDLYVRLCILEARLEGIEERRRNLSGALAQLLQLHDLASRLEADPELRSVTADDPRVLCHRAERQLIHLVEEDRQAVAGRILAGPMEDLADVALAAELIGHRVCRAPASHVAAEIAQTRKATHTAAARMERLIFQISPLGIEDGLVTAVRRVAADLAGEIAVRVQVVGEEPRLLPDVALTAFRVAVEAIDNAVRHGRADEVEVVLSFGPGRVHLVVADHGEGFDVAATEARLGRTRALGLIGMRERVENAGGILDVRSALGAGTEVRVVFDTAWR